MTVFSKPEAYQLWMGRWSERLAPRFVAFTGLTSPTRILDVGAGTGALSQSIAARYARAVVVGIEPASDFVDYARQRLRDPYVTIETGDAQAIGFDADSFDAALALLVLQELPDGPRAVSEMRRVTKAGGCVAACQWDFRKGMPMLSLFWEVAQDVVPDPSVHAEAKRRSPLGYSDANALARLWQDCGLVDVRTEALDITMDFVSFEDYWAPFLGGATPTSSYALTLPDAARRELSDGLRRRLLGDGPDRPFNLPARAWAVSGKVP